LEKRVETDKLGKSKKKKRGKRAIKKEEGNVTSED